MVLRPVSLLQNTNILELLEQTQRKNTIFYRQKRLHLLTSTKEYDTSNWKENVIVYNFGVYLLDSANGIHALFLSLCSKHCVCSYQQCRLINNTP